MVKLPLRALNSGPGASAIFWQYEIFSIFNNFCLLSIIKLNIVDRESTCVPEQALLICAKFSNIFVHFPFNHTFSFYIDKLWLKEHASILISKPFLRKSENNIGSELVWKCPSLYVSFYGFQQGVLCFLYCLIIKFNILTNFI